jgi:hypothetical protein
MLLNRQLNMSNCIPVKRTAAPRFSGKRASSQDDQLAYLIAGAISGLLNAI